MTVRENLARLFPLHYQRICEIAHENDMLSDLEQPTLGRWRDLASLFLFCHAEEGHDYWRALATGEGLR